MTRDGRWIAWTTNENGYSRVFARAMDAANAPPRYGTMAPPLPRGIYAIDFAKEAPVLSIRVGGPSVAGDVWLWDARTGQTSRATESATGGLDARKFVEPEALSFESFDGETVYGLLYMPRNVRAGTKPPVVLGVHGGPTAQARPSYSAPFQYLLSRGIAVFDLNFRGSTGYGKRYTRLDNQRLRPNAVKDMASALEYLQASGRVDATRSAVMGGSYGGYMTFAALTQLPDLLQGGSGVRGRVELGDRARGGLATAQGERPDRVRQHRRSRGPKVLRGAIADHAREERARAAHGAARRQRSARSGD